MNNELEEINKKLDIILELLKPKEYPDITISDYLQQWLNDFRSNVSSSTLYKDTNIVRNHIVPVLGLKHLCDIDLAKAQSFINSIQAPRQREHIYVLLKHSFRKAQELGYVPSNPFLNIVMAEHDPIATPILSDEALTLFFSLCEPKDFSSFYTLAYEGMRPSELLALTPFSITPHGISITNSYDSKNRCIGKTKTKQSIRVIPYFANVENIVPKIGTRLFEPYILRNLEDAFKKIVHSREFSVYLVPRLSLYSLRHTCITNWAKSGVHPKIAMKWSGHNNLATTMRYYTHIDQKWEENEVLKTKVQKQLVAKIP